MLFPQQNAFRSVFDLSGFWMLKPDPDDLGLEESWFSETLGAGAMTVAVPGAWNEQLAERGLMNYVGMCWYETVFRLPRHAGDTGRTTLYVGAADHHARVWLNGQFVGEHIGGYLPFELDLSEAVRPDGLPNRLTVAVDSRLSMHTLPQDVDPSSPPYDSKSYDRRHLYPPTRFDFFPYGGLTRAVRLVSTPEAHIGRLEIDTDLSGSVRVGVTASGGEAVRCRIVDPSGAEVAKTEVATGGETSVDLSSHVGRVEPWSPANPSLYTAIVELLDANGEPVDAYEEHFGFREVRIDGGRILLNGEPLFLTGFGKHEDYPIVGRGQHGAAYVKDFELMRWINANSFRTSHYPYDEELIRLADRLGFLVIDEVPAVSLGFWSDDLDDLRPLLDNHKRAVSELIARDRNHPSVISWSIVNEANLWAEEHYQNEAAARYFEEVYQHTKSLDESRPVMSIIMAVHSDEDVALPPCDVIGLNRYFGWYTEPVDIDFAVQRLEDEMERIFDRFGKPIVMTEFGADTVEGYHATNAQFFTEEFQTVFLMAYAELLESKDYCAGMHVWNFADFRTPQHFRRVVLNKKGVFNRSREPKMAAFVLRDYWAELERVNADHRPSAGEGGLLVRDLKRPVRWRYEGAASHVPGPESDPTPDAPDA